MEQTYNVTYDRLLEIIDVYKQLFDVVRVVEPEYANVVDVCKDGTIKVAAKNCFAIWDRQERCVNCISGRALVSKSNKTKFEFVDNDTYFVLAEYFNVEGKDVVLELVKKIDEETLLKAEGENRFVDRITTYNDQMYKDSLTKVRNRRYLDEQVYAFSCEAIAMIDIDYFKKVNDTYGHAVGDIALKKVAQAIRNCVREADSVIRFGGDEFVLVLESVPKHRFEEILNMILEEVRNIRIEEEPDAKITVSIGGAYGYNKSKKLVYLADKALYAAKKIEILSLLGMVSKTKKNTIIYKEIHLAYT